MAGGTIYDITISCSYIFLIFPVPLLTCHRAGRPHHSQSTQNNLNQPENLLPTLLLQPTLLLRLLSLDMPEQALPLPPSSGYQ